MAVFTALHTQRVLAPVLSPFECLWGEVVHWKAKWKEKGGKGWMEYEEKEKSIGEWEVRWMDIHTQGKVAKGKEG